MALAMPTPPEVQRPAFANIKRLSQEQLVQVTGDWGDKIKQAVAVHQPKKNQIVLNDKYWKGSHWDDVDEEWMPKPVENWVFATVEQHSANLATANIVPIITGQDPGDEEVAQIFDYVIQYLWTPAKLNMRRVVRRSIHTAMLTGTAIVKVYWDPTVNGGKPFSPDLTEFKEFKNPLNGSTYKTPHTMYKGEVAVEMVDPTNIIPDPAGYSLEGEGACEWIVIRTPRSLNWIQNNPMFIEYVGGPHRMKELIEQIGGNSKDKSSTEMYHDRVVNQTHRDERQLDEIWNRRMDESGNYHVDLLYMVDDQLLFYAEDVYKDGRYPLAILYDVEVNKSFFGLGEPDQVIPNQNTINQINRLAALNAMHMTNTQKVVTYDSGIDPKEVAKFGTMPGAVWRSRTVDGIKPLEVKEIPISVFKVAETAREGIRQINAMDEANMGQFGGSVTAASGIKMIQDKANVRDQDKGYNVEDFVSRVTSLIISRIQQFYTTERYIPILDQSVHPALQGKFFPFTGSQHEDVTLFVTVQSGSGTPLNKQAIAQRAWDMFVKQSEAGFDPPLITVEELLDCLDGFPIKERIKRRVKEASTMKAANEAIEMARLFHEMMMAGIPVDQLPPEELMALVQQFKAQQAAQPAPEGAGAQPPAQQPQQV